MEWYSGSINDAVKMSKVNRAIFVVFIAGKDEVSTEVTKVIDTPEVSSCLKTDDFIAIKLESGSEDYNFFAQIYQLVPVPSLFFIGLNGQPLEVVVGNVTVSNLKDKIDGVLTKVGKGKSNSSNAFISAEQSAGSVSNILQSTASSSEVVNTQFVERTAGSSATDTKQTSAGRDESKSDQADSVTSNTGIDDKSTTKLSDAEKVERARMLIELQKKQQMEKEREEEKRREKERRDIGKNMQNARQRQQDMELAIAHEERMKEKAMEREARERVMQQIAQDKLERKHREQAILTTKNQQNQEVAQPQPQQAAPQFVGDGVVRIQFRLPSGTPHMGKFMATTTLRELRVYVSNNIDLPFRQFSMSMSFPRRDLTTEDDEKTLLDLELVPTAVILILPLKNSGGTTVTPAHGDSFWSRFMWALFAPIFTVYNYLAGYFTGGPSGSTNSQSNGSNASGESERSGFIARNMNEPSATLRSRGNVHRLHSGTDDNDENNTWNGNSTQQM